MGAQTPVACLSEHVQNDADDQKDLQTPILCVSGCVHNETDNQTETHTSSLSQ